MRVVGKERKDRYEARVSSEVLLFHIFDVLQASLWFCGTL